ncbi:MAG TPA: hypothetical protein VF139_17020, partial [Candidatus Polarisedimenticolaceae bacterium]
VAREGKLVFSTFDPVTGSGRPIASLDARNPAERQWDLSPDGLRIAVWDGDRGAVTILVPSNGELRTLTTEKLLNFGAFWTSSSDALLVSGWKGDRSIVLRMDMEGKTQVLLEATGMFRVGVVPSPDGKRLACMAGSLNSNAWLLENF